MKANKYNCGGFETIKTACIALGVLLCFIAFAHSALAQVRNSTITGTVTDQNGRVVPSAEVVVTNEGTNVATKTVSGAAGDYSVPYLPEGLYSVSIDVAGFRTYHVTDIAVASDIVVRVDAKLSVGSTSQVVEVKAATAELQTENATVSNAIETQVIQNIPNITNNPLYYATLSPGVVPTPALYGGSNLGVGFQDRQAFSAIRINGGMLGTNDDQLDGVSVQGSAWHEVVVTPNRDALQEVTASTNVLSADMGGGQGIISMVTKSGTNSFHGDLNYILRNEIFDANGLANDIQGIPRGKFRVNEGGGAVGGPVIIPKLFNGKDRAFFFASYDRLTNSQPASGFARVPTDLQRQGNFSATLIHDQNGNPVPATIYNPFSATAVPGTGNQLFERTPYPNAIVTDPDQFGLKYLQAFPEPNVGSGNTAGNDVYNDNDYFYSGVGTTTRNELNTRLDFRLGKNSLYASGGLQNGATIGVNIWGPAGPWYNEAGPQNATDNNPYMTVGDVITLNPTAFIDLHAGVTRVETTTAYPNNNAFNTAQYTAYGMPSPEQSLIALSGDSPSVYDLGYGTPLNNAQWVNKNERQTNYDFNGSFTKILGKWTLKQGSDYRIYLGNWRDIEWGTPSLAAYDDECYCEQYSYVGGSPNFSFDQTPQQDGYSGAMAAIGVMGYRLDPGTTTKPALAAKIFSVYTQNDWKATRRLSVNLGLRYEIQPGPTERHNREYDVDLTVPGPFAKGLAVANQSGLAQMGMIAFAGQGGYSRNMWNTQFNNISPRVGFAYKLTESTVLRGGFGRGYVPSNSGFNANALIYGGGAFAGGAEMTPYGINQNGLPGGGGAGNGRFEDTSNTTLYPAPGPVQAAQLYGNGNSNSGVDYFLRSGYKNGYMDQWNFFVERRFKGWLASAGYVGSKGTHLGWRQYPLNGTFNIPTGTLADWRAGWLSSNGMNDPAQVQIPNPMPALVGKAVGPIGNGTISVMQSQENYLGLLGQTVYKSVGSSRFDALELELRHSYSNGLTAQFSYEWSKNQGISGGASNSTYAESQTGTLAPSGSVDYTNLNNNKGILGADVPQRFVGLVTYSLPFGAGKRYQFENPVARQLAGGWQLGTVVTLQSGQPWGPSCGGSLNGRCIPTGQPLQVPKALQHWYDGNTSVVLPDGRQVTPGQYTYLKWNPDAFTSQMAQFPNGSYTVDQYWNGTTPIYMGGLRLPTFDNVNFNLSRSFKIKEALNFEVVAEATNLFNRTNFLPSAVNNSFSPVTVADPSSNSQVGENSNNNAGTLSLSTMDPRQITFTARFNF